MSKMNTNKIYFIVAISSNYGIGLNNQLPWPKIDEDFEFFKKITLNNNVVMGNKTYESILDMNKKPLQQRQNIVISKSKKQSPYDNVLYIDPDSLYAKMINYKNQKQKLEQQFYVIGGKQTYDLFKEIVDQIIVTHILQEYEFDTSFISINHKSHIDYVMSDYQSLQTSKKSKIQFQHLTYDLFVRQHSEYQYLQLLKELIQQDNTRNDRTGTGTKSVFGRNMRFDISNTVPIITTKKTAWKVVIKELLWFLRGETDNKILQKQGVNIWSQNSSREFLDSNGLQHLEENDCGAIYSHQWKYFGAEYVNCKTDYSGQGFDQIQYIIDEIKINPDSRRLILSALNPADYNKQCLPPCHVLAQWYCRDNQLSCQVYQRSADVFLGLPFNIFSYTVLTYIIAKKTNRIPHELMFCLGDAHLYNNHVNQAKQQLKESLKPQPKLLIDDCIKVLDFKDIDVSMFKIIGYFYGSQIKAPMAT